MCLCGLRFKKHIIFHILYITVAPLCPAFLKRIDFYKAFWEAKRALIGQLSSALWLAEYLKRETEMLCPLSYCDAVSRRDDTKTIKPIINEAFVASSGDIITDYNDLSIGLKLNSWRAAALHSLAPTSSKSHLLGSF